MENKKLDIVRHSTAHILATAVLEMFPDAKIGIGPTIENGFYYDFDLPRTLIPEDLNILEEKMRLIIRDNHPFKREEVTTEEAIKLFEKLKQPYKVELIKDLVDQEKVSRVTCYTSHNFVDLCRGPHLDSTGEIKADSFKLLKIAGAYWRGDEKRPMLQRIYGTTFANKKELAAHLQKLSEAEKRDHRKLGKELELFIFSDLVGPGMPLYTHRGAFVRQQIINYSNELQKKIGYQEVHTPNINKAELFKISGHYDKYKDDMLEVKSHYSAEQYFLKPMNCPQHTQIYASKIRSYKDLPIRIADFANLYRDEKPGELSGLSRLRCFCQDDGHCFCREDQIDQEFKNVLNAIKAALKTYGLKFRIRLSLRDPQRKEKYIGDDALWQKAEEKLENILKKNKIAHTSAEGEAAFYGPKMDVIVKDVLDREWQISTIQLDFSMPQRFGLKYIDKDGSEKTPVMIHRAIIGSPERFMSILLEHFGGVFPPWLAPVQVAVIPIAKRHNKYAKEIAQELAKHHIRLEVKDEDETVGKKIRQAETQKVLYMIIVGDKEMKAKSISIRDRKKGDLGSMKLKKFILLILEKIEKRSL